VVVNVDWKQVRGTLPERAFDLVVLVAVLSPELGGQVKAFRDVVRAPLMLLVESPSEDTHCELLDAGADFVLSRPCSPRLLVRYARVLMRYGGKMPAFSSAGSTPLIIGNLHLDPSTHQVTIDGKTQHLTQLEFRLLYVFMNDAGHVIPIDDIVERVWGYSGEGNRDLVRGLIRRLRKKIEPSMESSRYIFNVPGVGYRFAKD
jgi:DNA-binding response OmpR family regulator